MKIFSSLNFRLRIVIFFQIISDIVCCTRLLLVKYCVSVSGRLWLYPNVFVVYVCLSSRNALLML